LVLPNVVARPLHFAHDFAVDESADLVAGLLERVAVFAGFQRAGLFVDSENAGGIDGDGPQGVFNRRNPTVRRFKSAAILDSHPQC
jgi:hypothetical protein